MKTSIAWYYYRLTRQRTKQRQQQKTYQVKNKHEVHRKGSKRVNFRNHAELFESHHGSFSLFHQAPNNRQVGK